MQSQNLQFEKKEVIHYGHPLYNKMAQATADIEAEVKKPDPVEEKPIEKKGFFGKKKK